jgi:hypothetical protein
LVEHVKVTNATFEHGLLIVELKREVPEALKPHRIEIATRHDSVGQTKVTTLEHSKVAQALPLRGAFPASPLGVGFCPPEGLSGSGSPEQAFE